MLLGNCVIELFVRRVTGNCVIELWVRRVTGELRYRIVGEVFCWGTVL